MKLMIAILKHEDSECVSNALVAAQFRVTEIASTGGFFHHGSTTIMIGLSADKVEEAIEIIRNVCTTGLEPSEHRATLFVINIAHFEQI